MIVAVFAMATWFPPKAVPNANEGTITKATKDKLKPHGL
jgi:hypothetical protein